MKHIPLPLLRLIAGFVAAIYTVGYAFGGELQCPLAVNVDQKVTGTPSGWTAGYNGYKEELESVTIYDGPPEQGASLVYDDQKTLANTIVQTWNLAPNDHGYWMTCGYSNTSAQLTQKIPSDATRCEVTLERDVSFGNGLRPVRKAICATR